MRITPNLRFALLLGASTIVLHSTCLRAQTIDGQEVSNAAHSPEKTGQDEPSKELFTRRFRLNPNHLMELLHREKIPNSENLAQDVRTLFKNAGIDLTSEEGSAMFYNDRTGILMLRAPVAGLDRVEAFLNTRLQQAPAQITLRALVAEFSPTLLNPTLAESLRWLQDESLTNDTLARAVLTEAETKTLVRLLEQTEGVDLVSLQPTTTLSGRQARLAIEETRPIVTDPPFTAPGKDAKARWSTKESPPFDATE